MSGYFCIISIQKENVLEYGQPRSACRLGGGKARKEQSGVQKSHEYEKWEAMRAHDTTVQIVHIEKTKLGSISRSQRGPGRKAIKKGSKGVDFRS